MAFGNAVGQGFVNRSVITAQEVIIEGNKGRLLAYNGTPALGTLIASIAGLPGTDQYGNEYLQGVVSYQPGSPATAFALQAGQIQVYTGPGSGGPWTANGLFFQGALGELAIYSGVSGTVGDVGTSIIVSSKDDSGGLAVVSGIDGNTYDTQRLSQHNMTATTVNTTSFTPIAGMAGLPVKAGRVYNFDGMIRVKQGAVANAAGNVGFSGPAVSEAEWYLSNNAGPWSVQGSPLATVNVLGSVAANTETYAQIMGTLIFSADGTLQLGGIASAGNSFTIQPGCMINYRPIII